MFGIRVALTLLVGVAMVTPAWCRHILTAQDKGILQEWLAGHPGYRVATDEDCGCAGEIQRMKAGYGGAWKPVPHYHPYAATGDFNSEGLHAFAVAVIDSSKSTENFTLLVFNGPFHSKKVLPAFVASALDLRGCGLFFGPPRPKPYRLVVGRFESDNTAILVPHGRTYKLDGRENN